MLRAALRFLLSHRLLPSSKMPGKWLTFWCGPSPRYRTYELLSALSASVHTSS